MQPILPPEDIFLQFRHTSAQILCTFHLGPPSGFGRMPLHPKYIRVRNWGPNFFAILRKSEPTPIVNHTVSELGAVLSESPKLAATHSSPSQPAMLAAKV